MSLNEILKKFFDMICIKMDPKPQPWGVWHLSFLIIGIGLAIFISYKLRHASLKTFNRVLRIVGFSLIGLEVFKLMYNYYALYDMDYNQIMFIFPFQLCSMPLYMSVIASYLREDSKVRKAMLTFMMTFSLMSGVAAYIEPSGILNSTLVSTIHSCVWHLVLVFFGFFIGFSGRVGKEFGDFLYAEVLFIVCCMIALCLNVTLPLFMTHDLDSVNMFFIGPQRSSLIVFCDIYDKFGWVVQAISYVVLLSIGGFIVFLPFVLTWRAKKRKKVPAASVPDMELNLAAQK